MSYTEYLRRKAAATPVIFNTVKPTDSSMYTQKVRQMASSVFQQNSSFHKGSTLQSNDRSGNMNQVITSYKSTGKSVDCSSYISFVGSQAIKDDNASIRGKILGNTSCNVPYLFDAPQSGSDYIRRAQGLVKQCKPTPHTKAGDKVDGPKFVDNTIRLSAGIVPCNSSCPSGTPKVIHSVKDVPPFMPLHTTRNNVKTSTLLYQEGGDHPYKAGASLRKIPYVEKHHGNDLLVNPRRLFKKYQGNGPAHLRINDPTMAPVKPY
jgi:hypothetical protein